MPSPVHPPTLKLMTTEWPKLGMVAVQPGPGDADFPSQFKVESYVGFTARAQARVRSGSAGAAGLVIVGGGPAGAPRPRRRTPQRMDVVLYDGGSSRGRGRWRASCRGLPLVDEIFGPGSFPPDEHLPAYANESRWGSDELETADFVFDPFGHGWHVRRPAFDAALLEAVRRMDVRVVNERVTRVPQAAFVIDATGRSARIARAFGARRGGPTASSPSSAKPPWRARPPRSSRTRTGGHTPRRESPRS